MKLFLKMLLEYFLPRHWMKVWDKKVTNRPDHISIYKTWFSKRTGRTLREEELLVIPVALIMILFVFTMIVAIIWVVLWS